MTEFQELVKDAPKFALMERGELVAYAYGMYAAGAKKDAENAKLRELVRDMYKAFMHGNCYRWCEFKEPCNYISDGRCQWYDRMRELGVEVD